MGWVVAGTRGGFGSPGQVPGFPLQTGFGGLTTFFLRCSFDVTAAAAAHGTPIFVLMLGSWKHAVPPQRVVAGTPSAGTSGFLGLGLGLTPGALGRGLTTFFLRCSELESRFEVFGVAGLGAFGLRLGSRFTGTPSNDRDGLSGWGLGLTPGARGRDLAALDFTAAGMASAGPTTARTTAGIAMRVSFILWFR